MSTSLAPIPHPSATANRIALANEIVAVLDENPGWFAAGRPSSFAVEQFGPDLWAVINHALGRDRVISPMTVAVVIGILVGRSV